MRVFKAVKLGHLKASKCLRKDRRGKQWVFTRDAVEAWLTQAGGIVGRRGRPPKSVDLADADTITLLARAKSVDYATAFSAVRELWRRHRCKVPLDADRLGVEYIEEEGYHDLRAKASQTNARQADEAAPTLSGV